jgi:kumamolisin
MTSARRTIAGSERKPLDAAPLGPVDPGQRAEVSLYLKRPEGAPQAGGAHSSREALHRRREASLEPQIERIAAFAAKHGLEVTTRDPGRRLVRLAGTLDDLQTAFGAHLQMFDHPVAGPVRARSGALTAPGDVADLIEAVLGLDQRPVATPKSIRLASPAADAGNLPNAVTRRYGFPEGAGQGECIALIELGGGVSDADTAAAFQAMALTPPKVVPVLVDGGTNAPGQDPDSDGEVALDVQVAGAGAPQAVIAVYFATNTDQGFVDAISQAAHDTANAPSVMSISWGSAESGWTQQAVSAMNAAFQDAVDLGVSVFAASGDGLATDGQSDGKAHVDFPASSEWVVGCGGTRLGAEARAAETVWNSEGGGTGGGISDLFAAPAYQASVTLPPDANGGSHKGRGVPDVAGDADPDTGYRVVVDGKAQVIGGTSAVAPLWAGLFALVNAAAGKPVGQPHATLYAHPEAFNDVTHGNNESGGVGYKAAKGWDACTGLGTPRGAAIAALFTE